MTQAARQLNGKANVSQVSGGYLGGCLAWVLILCYFYHGSVFVPCKLSTLEFETEPVILL